MIDPDLGKEQSRRFAKAWTVSPCFSDFILLSKNKVSFLQYIILPYICHYVLTPLMFQRLSFLITRYPWKILFMQLQPITGPMG